MTQRIFTVFRKDFIMPREEVETSEHYISEVDGSRYYIPKWAPDERYVAAYLNARPVVYLPRLAHMAVIVGDTADDLRFLRSWTDGVIDHDTNTILVPIDSNHYNRCRPGDYVLGPMGKNFIVVEPIAFADTYILESDLRPEPYSE